MSLITRRSLALVLTAVAACAALVLPACADGQVVDPTIEEPAFADGKADGVDADNWTYFQMKAQDFRRCMYPLCGGVYVGRTNQSKVKCGGVWEKQCYVSEYDFSAIAQGEEAIQLHQEATAGRLIVRGEIRTGFHALFPDVAVLAVTEAWRAPTDVAPTGIFYRAEDLGIVCITTPCLSIELTRLNRNASPISQVAGLDLKGAGASDEQLDDAWQQLHDGGLVVAGKIRALVDQGGAKGLVASQFYTRFVSATE